MYAEFYYHLRKLLNHITICKKKTAVSRLKEDQLSFMCFKMEI